ncbi:PD-(D/E)XK nuclease family protein [Pedobacter panaciterrae]|uniref:PD-(D/E)XK nuclease family protein n=1 Tax=Pedobacter panaciterrae TaxID=363849 RepID=A0ABU8NSC0_9SPHI
MIKTPLEDFTTEILVFILNSDIDLSNEFVNEVLRVEGEDFKIDSQVVYPYNENNRLYCRIDMVFKNSEMICFLENKVHSNEGYDQLWAYSKVLHGLGRYTKTYLRYCTKYHDNKHMTDHDFKQFRWCNIANFLRKWKDKEIIGQFLNFLEINQMGNSTDFTIQEILSLEHFNNAFMKMESYLEKIKPQFISVFGDYNKVQDSKVIEQLRDFKRVIFRKINIIGNGYSELGVGFDFSAKPILMVWIWLDSENSKIQSFNSMLSSLPMYENSKGYFTIEQPMSDFLSSSDMELAIEKWFIKGFDAVKKLIDENPNVGWNDVLIEKQIL